MSSRSSQAEPRPHTHRSNRKPPPRDRANWQPPAPLPLPIALALLTGTLLILSLGQMALPRRQPAPSAAPARLSVQPVQAEGPALTSELPPAGEGTDAGRPAGTEEAAGTAATVAAGPEGAASPAAATGMIEHESDQPLPPPPKFTIHTVAAGDTLSSLAERYGVTVATLAAANEMGPEDLLQIGQELRVPRVDGLLYRIAEGDTLWDLAVAYGVDPDVVIRANPDTEPAALQIGDWLLIPGARPREQVVMVAARGGGDSRQAAAPQVAPQPTPAPGSPAADGGFEIWPLSGEITSPFGWRIHPVRGNRSFHDGIDIAGDTGDIIVAVAPGVVTLAEWYGGWGLTVKVDHGGGLVTRYSHASRLLVRVGETVAAGQPVARVGSTGVSTGPHLDFGVYVNGKAQDPLDWLP